MTLFLIASLLITETGSEDMYNRRARVEQAELHANLEGTIYHEIR